LTGVVVVIHKKKTAVYTESDGNKAHGPVASMIEMTKAIEQTFP
jgi:hypothetical protein